MTIANSQTLIVNKALVLCGAATITNITDNSPNAIALNNVYELSLQSILSECKWNFCTIRNMPSVLASSSTTYPAFLMPGEVVVYALPSNVIRIWQTNPINARVREESGNLISDTVNLGIFYTYYDDNPNDYPSYFLDAFIDKLCSDIAYLIINNAQIAASFLKKYEGVSLPKAMSSNSQTGIQQMPRDGAWVNAKFYDSGNYDPSEGAVAI
jgi:hypothetical protein